MRVAVVTPYFREPRAWLERCLDSVRRQSLPCEHLLVADGQAQDWIDGAGVQHLRLGRSHADYGNTPRSIGAQLAVSQGCDAIAFLDADNWYEPQHVQTCIEAAQRSGADWVAARRHLSRDDGSRIALRIAEDDDFSHVDTNCFFVLFGAFHTLPRWALMPKPMAMWSDRFYLDALRAEGLREAHCEVATVNYLCTWANVFEAVGETPPPYAKSGLPVERLAAWLQRLQPGDLAHVRRLSGVDLPDFLARRSRRHAA